MVSSDDLSATERNELEKLKEMMGKAKSEEYMQRIDKRIEHMPDWQKWMFLDKKNKLERTLESEDLEDKELK